MANPGLSPAQLEQVLFWLAKMHSGLFRSISDILVIERLEEYLPMWYSWDRDKRSAFVDSLPA